MKEIPFAFLSFCWVINAFVVPKNNVDGKFSTMVMGIASWSSLEQESVERKLQRPREFLGNSMLEPPTGQNIVLYRDRNGWCPYSERVWLGLLQKEIEFDEVLINLQGAKPSWYYQVSSGSTPAIKFTDGSTKSESLDLLSEIDEQFPDNPPLFPSDPDLFASSKALISAFRNAMPKFTRPSSRGAFLFRSAGGPIFRSEFENSLDEIEKLLAKHPEGPFFLGSFGFSAVDCAWAPFLERWAVQLPLLHKGLRPREMPNRWPRLADWYNAMDNHMPAYLSRVRGDPHTWSYVLSDAAGGALAQQIWEDEMKVQGDFGCQTELLMALQGKWNKIWKKYSNSFNNVAENPGTEAAQRVLLNKEAIVADIVRRCSMVDKSVADAALRLLVQSLMEVNDDKLASNCEIQDFETSPQYFFINQEVNKNFELNDMKQLSDFAIYFSNRICTPRDMGILPARCLKAHLKLLHIAANQQ